MNRPEIIIDVDGPLYSWVTVMSQWLEYNHVLDDWEAAVARYRTWSVWEDWGISEGEFMRWWRLGIEAGVVYGQGPVTEGAREALWRLSDADFHITLHTSRLNRFGIHEKVIENTVSWLREANLPYRSLHFGGNKAIGGAMYIVDDSTRHLKQAASVGVTPILWHDNHNADKAGYLRARDWRAVLYIIEEGITE